MIVKKKTLKRATFKFVDGYPSKCAKHKLDNMISVDYPCEVCGIQSTYGYKEDNKPIRCCDDAEQGMINLRSPRCRSCGIYIVKGKKSKCSYCSVKEEVSYKRFEKRYENGLINLLATNKIEFVANKKVSFENNYFRPDIKIVCDNYFIIIECDENQHKQYTAEEERLRMISIYKGLGEISCVFVRYNPNGFKVGSKRSKKIPMEKRYELLIKHLKEIIKPVNTIESYKLFFDTDNIGEYTQKEILLV